MCKNDIPIFNVRRGFLIMLLSLMLFSILAVMIAGVVSGGELTTLGLRISTVIQDCFIFILPAIVTAVLVSALPARFLSIDRGFSLSQLILSLLGVIVSMPAMNILVKWNSALTLPDCLHNLEVWMKSAEERAQSSVELLLGQPTISSLIIDILIVSVLAGLSEELFFRGALMRLFRGTKLNIHYSIWLTALIFTTFHFQFYGFFPRLLLGAYFGYLVYWSNSLWLPVITHTFNNTLVVGAMWGTKLRGEEVMNEINHFGESSFTLILGSVILTIFVIKHLYRIRTDNRQSGDLKGELKAED